MKRIMRWFRFGALSVVLLLALGSAIVYVLSERILRRAYTEPRVEIAVPKDSISMR